MDEYQKKLWIELDRRNGRNGDGIWFSTAAGGVVCRGGVARMRESSRGGAGGGWTSRATRGSGEVVLQSKIGATPWDWGRRSWDAAAVNCGAAWRVGRKPAGRRGGATEVQGGTGGSSEAVRRPVGGGSMAGKSGGGGAELRNVGR